MEPLQPSDPIATGDEAPVACSGDTAILGGGEAQAVVTLVTRQPFQLTRVCTSN